MAGHISLVGLALVIAAAALPVRAQEAPLSAPMVTARPDAPVAPPTPAERQAAETLALARQVYDLVGDQALEGQLRTLSTTLEVQVAEAMAGKDRARARAIVDAVGQAVDDLRPDIASAAVKAMAADFTDRELADMLAFYRSSSGQAALAKLPLITRQSMASTLNVLPDLMAAVQTDFCAKVACSERDRGAFAAATARLAAVRPSPTRPAGRSDNSPR